MNDGSTDDSLSICERYAENYSNFRIINQCNTGASIARKNGIEVSKGEYLIFVDSDDYVSPHYVSALYNSLIRTATDIAVCRMKRLNPGGAYDFQKPARECILTQEELFKRFFKYEFWGYGAACYKRTVFDDIIFPEATVNEDYYVKAQMFSKEEKVAYVDTALYFYEQHTGSLSKQPLSLRALGEFDNALATWNYIKVSVPQYSGQALAIASEVACKWLGNLKTTTDHHFDSYKLQISDFVKDNLCRIIFNPMLLWKIKLVIIRNLI